MAKPEQVELRLPSVISPPEIGMAAALHRVCEAKAVAPGSTFHAQTLQNLLELVARPEGLAVLDRFQNGRDRK